MWASSAMPLRALRLRPKSSVLSKIMAAGPFPPLVLHPGNGNTSAGIARDPARTRSGWRIASAAASDAAIAAACHIVIVMAPGTEHDSAHKASSIWLLGKKSQASGRTIVHMPIVVDIWPTRTPRTREGDALSKRLRSRSLTGRPLPGLPRGAEMSRETGWLSRR